MEKGTYEYTFKMIYNDSEGLMHADVFFINEIQRHSPYLSAEFKCNDMNVCVCAVDFETANTMSRSVVCNLRLHSHVQLCHPDDAALCG